ncbi:acyl-CoA carboxylase epsilon subunit [Actinoplanes sp. TFC3]|uniref:acyl-CoA carboxylase epsilon subunit n=1 Tax=Actinoplanes sp. TFC3 TaxID=1710355 RepID=UPI0009E6D4CF|nr:acyl-CoA carboxylase epsilon subunit [Actinoplanes sp. TFC3]
MNEEPLVSVVRGEPAPEELAALIVALTSLSTPADPAPAPAPPATWASSAHPGYRPASWRASGLPA